MNMCCHGNHDKYEKMTFYLIYHHILCIL